MTTNKYFIAFIVVVIGIVTAISMILTVQKENLKVAPEKKLSGTPISCEGADQYPIYSTPTGNLEPGYFATTTGGRYVAVTSSVGSTSTIVTTKYGASVPLLTLATTTGFRSVAHCGGTDYPMPNAEYNTLRTGAPLPVVNGGILQ